MAPTMLAASPARNVMPARASVELDCRILPGTTADDVLASVRAGSATTCRYELEYADALVAGSAHRPPGPLPAAVAAVPRRRGRRGVPAAGAVPRLHRLVYLRAAAGTAAYGFSPFRATPAEVLAAGYHNADERIHVDDLRLSARFHRALARRLLG